jgi:hypothetical protein
LYGGDLNEVVSYKATLKLFMAEHNELGKRGES